MVEKYELNEDAFKEFKNVSDKHCQYFEEAVSVITTTGTGYESN